MGGIRAPHPLHYPTLMQCRLSRALVALARSMRLTSWPGLSAIRASAAGQRFDPLDLFAPLLVEDGVAEVDVPVQARMRVILLFGRWA